MHPVSVVVVVYEQQQRRQYFCSLFLCVCVRNAGRQAMEWWWCGCFTYTHTVGTVPYIAWTKRREPNECTDFKCICTVHLCVYVCVCVCLPTTSWCDLEVLLLSNMFWRERKYTPTMVVYLSVVLLCLHVCAKKKYRTKIFYVDNNNHTHTVRSVPPLHNNIV